MKKNANQDNRVQDDQAPSAREFRYSLEFLEEVYRRNNRQAEDRYRDTLNKYRDIAVETFEKELAEARSIDQTQLAVRDQYRLKDRTGYRIYNDPQGEFLLLSMRVTDLHKENYLFTAHVNFFVADMDFVNRDEDTQTARLVRICEILGVKAHAYNSLDRHSVHFDPLPLLLSGPLNTAQQEAVSRYLPSEFASLLSLICEEFAGGFMITDVTPVNKVAKSALTYVFSANKSSKEARNLLGDAFDRISTEKFAKLEVPGTEVLTTLIVEDVASILPNMPKKP